MERNGRRWEIFSRINRTWSLIRCWRKDGCCVWEKETDRQRQKKIETERYQAFHLGDSIPRVREQKRWSRVTVKSSDLMCSLRCLGMTEHRCWVGCGLCGFGVRRTVRARDVDFGVISMWVVSGEWNHRRGFQREVSGEESRLPRVALWERQQQGISRGGRTYLGGRESLCSENPKEENP